MLLKLEIFSILLIVFITNTLAHQWIDPHDMNTKAKQKYMKPTLKKSSSTSSIIEQEYIDPLKVICYSNLRRIISVLMKSAHIDKRDPDLFHGHIRFNLDPQSFDFMDNFGKDDISLENLRKLDSVVSESFKRTYIEEYLDTMESFQLKFYSIFVNIQILWLLGVIFILYVVYQLFKNNFSFAYITKYLILIVLIADFGFRYQQLLEDAEEHNLGVVYSRECDTMKMSWVGWTKYMFSTRICEKKSVTPLDAFLYQIKHLIIIPMDALGTGMGGFGKNMFTTLPWGLNLIMWPVMIIFSLILLLFGMTIFTGQSIEFNIFHLVKLKFGGGSHRDNTLTFPTVERLLDKVLHRPMVQNVNVSLPSTSSQPSSENRDSLLLQSPDTKTDSSLSESPVVAKPLAYTNDKIQDVLHSADTKTESSLSEGPFAKPVTYTDNKIQDLLHSTETKTNSSLSESPVVAKPVTYTNDKIQDVLHSTETKTNSSLSESPIVANPVAFANDKIQDISEVKKPVSDKSTNTSYIRNSEIDLKTQVGNVEGNNLGQQEESKRQINENEKPVDCSTDIMLDQEINTRECTSTSSDTNAR